MSSKCKDFITKCLKKNPRERLGSREGPSEITNHPWFSDIDIKDLINKTIVPDFKPHFKKDILYDLQNFSKKITSQEAEISEVPKTIQR